MQNQIAVPHQATHASRRNFLRVTAMTVGAAAVMQPTESEAAIWGFLARSVVVDSYPGGSIGRWIGIFASTAEPDTEHKSAPSNSQFHNRHASPWEVANPEAKVGRQKVGSCKGKTVSVSLNRIIGDYDLNDIELQRIRHEECYYGAPMVPIGLRSPINDKAAKPS